MIRRRLGRARRSACTGVQVSFEKIICPTGFPPLSPRPWLDLIGIPELSHGVRPVFVLSRQDSATRELVIDLARR
jgi:hypothetical protein